MIGDIVTIVYPPSLTSSAPLVFVDVDYQIVAYSKAAAFPGAEAVDLAEVREVARRTRPATWRRVAGEWKLEAEA